jgi:hypothetical protein
MFTLQSVALTCHNSPPLAVPMKVIPLDRFLKLLVYCAIAMACLWLGDMFTAHVRDQPEPSRWLRWLAVGVGVVSVMPWLSIIIGGVWLGDEFVHHVALVGTAIAFAGQLLFSIALVHLRDVGLMSASTHVEPIPVAIILWLLGCASAALYYRSRV